MINNFSFAGCAGLAVHFALSGEAVMASLMTFGAALGLAVLLRKIR